MMIMIIVKLILILIIIITTKRGRDTAVSIVSTRWTKYLTICGSNLGRSRDVQVPILNDFLGSLNFYDETTSLSRNVGKI
jgi:hypothetical protein